MIWSISVSETTIPESYFTMYFSIMRRAIKSTQTTIRRFSYAQTKIKRNGSHRRKSVLVIVKICCSGHSRKSVPAFYTLADSVIVGKTLGADSLVAVGATSIIIYFVFCFINGFTGGFGICLGQRCGAKDEKGMRKVSPHPHFSVLFLRSC